MLHKVLMKSLDRQNFAVLEVLEGGGSSSHQRCQVDTI